MKIIVLLLTLNYISYLVTGNTWLQRLNQQYTDRFNGKSQLFRNPVALQDDEFPLEFYDETYLQGFEPVQRKQYNRPRVPKVPMWYRDTQQLPPPGPYPQPMPDNFTFPPGWPTNFKLPPGSWKFESHQTFPPTGTKSFYNSTSYNYSSSWKSSSSSQWSKETINKFREHFNKGNAIKNGANEAKLMDAALEDLLTEYFSSKIKDSGKLPEANSQEYRDELLKYLLDWREENLAKKQSTTTEKQSTKTDKPEVSGATGRMTTLKSIKDQPIEDALARLQRIRICSHTCLNGATCQLFRLTGIYTCKCRKGWSGDFCEEDINECELAKPACGFNQRCINTPGSYKCRCYSGYRKTGRKCIVQTDCQMALCKHFGKCIRDRSGRHFCNCMMGWTGKLCETKIEECENNPCATGLGCVATRNGYECAKLEDLKAEQTAPLSFLDDMETSTIVMLATFIGLGLGGVALLGSWIYRVNAV